MNGSRTFGMLLARWRTSHKHTLTEKPRDVRLVLKLDSQGYLIFTVPGLPGVSYTRRLKDYVVFLAGFHAAK